MLKFLFLSVSIFVSFVSTSQGICQQLVVPKVSVAHSLFESTGSTQNESQKFAISAATDPNFIASQLRVRCKGQCLSAELVEDLKKFVAGHPLFAPNQLSFRNDDGPAPGGLGFWPYWPSLNPLVEGAVPLAIDTAVLLPAHASVHWIFANYRNYPMMTSTPQVLTVLINDVRFRRQLGVLFFSDSGEAQVIRLGRESSAPGDYMPGGQNERLILSLSDYLSETIQTLKKNSDSKSVQFELHQPTPDSPVQSVSDLKAVQNQHLIDEAFAGRGALIQLAEKEKKEINALLGKNPIDASVVREVMRWLFSSAPLVTEKSVLESTQNVIDGGLSGTCYLRAFFANLEFYRIGGPNAGLIQSFARGRLSTAWRPKADWSYHVNALVLVGDSGNAERDLIAIDDYMMDQRGLIPLPKDDFQLVTYGEWKENLREAHKKALDPLERFSAADFNVNFGQLAFITDSSHIFDARASLFMSAEDRRLSQKKAWLKFNLARLYVGDPGGFANPEPSDVGFPIFMRQAHLGAFISWLVRVKDEELSDDLKQEFFHDFERLLDYVQVLLDKQDPTIEHLLTFTPVEFREELVESLRLHRSNH